MSSSLSNWTGPHRQHFKFSGETHRIGKHKTFRAIHIALAIRRYQIWRFYPFRSYENPAHQDHIVRLRKLVLLAKGYKGTEPDFDVGTEESFHSSDDTE